MYYVLRNREYEGIAINTSNPKIAETIMKIFKKKHNLSIDYELSENIPDGYDIFDEHNETVLEVSTTIRILIEDAEYSPDKVVNMSSEERLQKVLEWNGIIGYTSSILEWVQDYVETGGEL